MLNAITDALVHLNEKKVLKLVEYATAQGATLSDIIAAIQAGLNQIGSNYESGEYGVTDLMMAGIIFEEILKMDHFKVESNLMQSIGTILLCTIEFDYHDIGKTIFKSMAMMAGLKVIDIGINIPPDEIVRQAKIHKPDVIGISSIMTEGIIGIKKTVDLLIESGIRDQIKIIIGGLATNDGVVEYTGVDAFAKDAFDGAQICSTWLSKGSDSNQL